MENNGSNIKILESFSDKENKAFIWNILMKNGLFNNIPNKKLKDVINLIDSSVISIKDNNINTNNTLVQLNKILIEKIRKDIFFLKTNIDIDLRNEKSVSFNNTLEIMKDDMNSKLNNNKPDEINFKNDKDTPIDVMMMDTKLQELLTNRKNLYTVPNNDSKTSVRNEITNEIKTTIDMIYNKDNIENNSIISDIENDYNKEKSSNIFNNFLVIDNRLNTLENKIDKLNDKLEKIIENEKYLIKVIKTQQEFSQEFPEEFPEEFPQEFPE